MNETLKRRFPKTLLCALTACIMLFSGFATTAYAAAEPGIVPVSTIKSQDLTSDVVIPFGLINYNITQQTITGPFDIGAFAGFNKDLRQDIYYSAKNCWQRNFGYCAFYDNAAPYFNMHFDYLRFYFNYGGKAWLVQAWKGQYGITTGGEVGIYYKPENSSRQIYSAVDDKDMLPMSLTMYYNGSKMFHRPMETTWWQTGFRLFKTYRSNVLGMKFSIDFKNTAMLNAFIGSIKSDMGIKYTVSGTTINISWNI